MSEELRWNYRFTAKDTKGKAPQSLASAIKARSQPCVSRRTQKFQAQLGFWFAATERWSFYSLDWRGNEGPLRFTAGSITAAKPAGSGGGGSYCRLIQFWVWKTRGNTDGNIFTLPSFCCGVWVKVWFHNNTFRKLHNFHISNSGRY